MRALFIHVVAVALLCAGPPTAVGWSPGGAGPDYVLAQRRTGTSLQDEGSRSGAGDEGKQSILVRKVLALLETQFVHGLADKRVFSNAMKKITFVLPPHCTEKADSMDECSDPPEQCFVESLQTISRTCGMDYGKLVMGALRSMLKDLDSNASLLDSTMLQELKISVSGRFGGVGMVVSERDGDYVVVAPFDGSPAHTAGIRPGDVILEIDGQSLHGLPLLEVLRMVRGPAGSRMTMTVRSGKTGRTGKVQLRRLVISIPPVKYAVLSGGVGYLRIVNFQENTAAQVVKGLQKMTERSRTGLSGLILDLRDNPGGLFEEAIMVADVFVSSGPITFIKGREAKQDKEFFSQGRASFPPVPTVVLINKGSASGSEILAGALQGKPNVLVMGEKSFGKASVQSVFPIGDDLALRITTAHYYTADGRDIEGKGLEPDMYVESREETLPENIRKPRAQEIETDPVVRQALECLERGLTRRESPFSNWY